MAKQNKRPILIFETRGYTTPTDFETLILNMHRRGLPVPIKKVDVLNAAEMKVHKDVVELLKKQGLDVLPVVKINNKLTSTQKAYQAIMQMVG